MASRTKSPHRFTRRQALPLIAAGLAAPAVLRLPRAKAAAPRGEKIMRPIPSTGEMVPAIGMGTWVTFNVGPSERLRDDRTKILGRFFEDGGTVIDSSPMYGSAEDVIGYGLERLPPQPELFSATKVWTRGRADGIAQMQASRELWDSGRLDLMQIHNMVDWRTHLETLRNWKQEGRIRYLGITTSHGRRHEAFAAAMSGVPFDAVQFTYNIADREAENRLLPLAAERGQATIINRPFRHKQLFRMVRGHDVPEWAAEFGALNWAQFFLKFVISHPAVTVAIPATSQLEHMAQNMGALYGPLPDENMRRRMVAHFESIV